MPTRIPHLSLANVDSRLRITDASGDVTRVIVIEVKDRGVRVRYPDQSVGVLMDADYDDHVIEALHPGEK